MNYPCSEIKDRAKNALNDLSNAEDPRKFGEAKYGKWKGAYSYDIGRWYRILYSGFQDKINNTP